MGIAHGLAMPLELERQTNFLKVPQGELDACFDAIKNAFDEQWLSDPLGRHKLQILWSRTDHVAVIELVSFGHALRTMQAKDAKWTKDNVKKIRTGQTNEQNGAFFEIYITGALLGAKMNVMPASTNNKGFDATIAFSDGTKLLLSMKNHDISSFEGSVQEHSRHLRTEIRNAFSRRGWPAVETTLIAERWLEDSDWLTLRWAADVWPNGTDGYIQPLDGVKLRIAPLTPERGLTFARGHFSDWFTAIVPYFKHEQKRFEDAIEAAVLNLKKQCSGRKEKKGCLIRVHPTADISRLRAVAGDLVNFTHPDVLDFIQLYQPAMVNNDKLTETFLGHYFDMTASPRWDPIKHPLEFRPFVGKRIVNPSEPKLVLGGYLLQPIKDRYMFGKGDHFYEASQIATEDFRLDFKRKPGLSVYAVANGLPTPNLVAPQDTLLIV